jgi:DNA-binding NtrC family response regulator
VVLPLGASKTVRVNVRLMASTAESPEKLVQDGRLREDLFHRIAAIRLHLPRLKERGEDLGFLLHHYLSHYATRFKKNITGISPKALRLLSNHDFPGNVRELKNIMEFAAMVCTDDHIEIEHLPGHLPGLLESAPARPRAATGRKTGRKNTEER